MKKSPFIALCVLALFSCQKSEPLKVTAQYTAKTFVSCEVYTTPPSSAKIVYAADYFDQQVKDLDEWVVASVSFSAEDEESEQYAYNKADAQASQLITENKSKVMEKLNAIKDDLDNKDLGAGEYVLKLDYGYYREGKTLDEFSEKISYNGGTRMLTEEIEFELAGKTSVADIPAKSTALEPGLKIEYLSGARVCLPDGTYIDSATYGNMLNKIEISEDESQEYYIVRLSLVADEAHMANIKKAAGNWHVIVPVKVDDEIDIVFYVPLKVTDSGI